MKTSVLIRNARLTDGSAPADLLVSGGVITTKAPAGTLLELSLIHISQPTRH